jgi:SulP family sulfate permease
MEVSQAITEILSGFTISMLMIPEAISFSLLLGLAPIMGMNSTMVVSAITSLLGGQPGLISGATGSVATSLAGVSKNIGKEFVVVAVIMGGLFQIVLGSLGLFKYFDKIPAPVISGFLIGLSALIAKGQLPYFKNADGTWLNSKRMMYTVGLISAGLVVSKLSAYLPGNIPGAIYGIAAVTLLAYITKVPVQTIKDVGNVEAFFPSPHVPKMPSKETFMRIVPYAFGMAVIGLIESLIMLKEAGRLLHRPGNPLREVFAQGAANIASGFSNGIGGCVLVGQSKLNYAHGARTRLSSVATCLSFGSLVILFSKHIGAIPMPALVATMIDIVIRTGDWKSLAGGFNSATATTLLTSAAAILSDNLAVGVVAGSIVHFALNVKA